MSWGVLPWVYPFWYSLGFLSLGDYFLLHFREIFNYYLLKYFLISFLFVVFYWDTYDSNVGVFNIVPEVSEVVFISFYYFFPLCFIYFQHYTTLLILSSASVILLLVPFRVILISVIALFITDQLFFIYSRCFSNISCIFLILVSPCL